MRDDTSVNTIQRENDTCYVRYDNYPAVDGHVEVVPKRHVVSYFDLTPREVLDAHALLVESQVELNSTHRPDGYTIGINEGRAAGRTIDHLHIHLVPRHYGDVADPRGGIRQVLPGPSPDDWTGKFSADPV
ncbi:HIT domain-containing protein [Streptomyces sp. SID13666]|nr:HIT domain-containing protein [Streptomyces sp. SID13666]NEA74526.1 HIT domain-containing protein [Streptomyces sp. SID13588]